MRTWEGKSSSDAHKIIPYDYCVIIVRLSCNYFDKYHELDEYVEKRLRKNEVLWFTIVLIKMTPVLEYCHIFIYILVVKLKKKKSRERRMKNKKVGKEVEK